MNEKNTDDLEKVLGNTHVKNFSEYYQSNARYMMQDVSSFFDYMKDLFKEKKITQQAVFLQADIPEKYGYKLLNGGKKTRQRDVILRICYAAGFSLEETQRALRKYEMPELYAKIQRDALLMIMFNERPGSIIDVNEILKQNGMDTLRTSGIQD